MKERKVNNMQVKGVNLGNWLVLEKWMSPGLFEGTTAEDEHNLPLQLPKEVYEARMKMHRAEYITERDFTRIKSLGLDTVRIPVPYFIFGDREPFIGCIGELDKAFNWAERYGQRKGLWGIEIINEPVLEDMWEGMHVQERYPREGRVGPYLAEVGAHEDYFVLRHEGRVGRDGGAVAGREVPAAELIGGVPGEHELVLAVVGPGPGGLIPPGLGGMAVDPPENFGYEAVIELHIRTARP